MEQRSIEELDHRDRARLAIDFWHRTVMHHAMWFAEIRHQLGRERAWEILEEAYSKSYGIQMKRLSKALGHVFQDLFWEMVELRVYLMKYRHERIRSCAQVR